MKTIKFILIAAIALAVTSCNSCRRTTSSNAPLTETRWGLVSIQGQIIERTDNFFLVFSKVDGRVSGRGDCNSISAGYTAGRDGSLALEPMISTFAFCPNQEIENKFTQALQSANGYSINGRTLMLTRDGQTILVFEAE